MKFTLCLAAALCVAAGSVRADVATNYPAAVQSAINAYWHAYTNSVYFTPPAPADVIAAKANHVTAKPHRHVNCAKLANQMATVNTSACPDDFKTAWRTLATILAAPENATLADLGSTFKEASEAIAETGTGVGAVRGAGEAGEAVGDAAKIVGRKQALLRARNQAFFQLRLCAASYGVTNNTATAQASR